MLTSSSRKISFLLFIVCNVMINATVVGQSAAKGNNKKLQSAVLATIGDIKITVHEFEAGYQLSPAFINKRENPKAEYLHYLINEKLLVLDGYNRKVDTSDFVKQMHSTITSDIAAGELFREDILNRVEINQTEVDEVVRTKQIEVELKWLYYNNGAEAAADYEKMKSGVAFDSLYNLQFINDVNYNDRHVKMDLHALRNTNPALALLVDSLQVRKPSPPLQTIDGWYIVCLENIYSSALTTQSEMITLQSEARKEIEEKQTQVITENYVRKLMEENQPVIKSEVFKKLIPFIAQYIVDPEKYKSWKLGETIPYLKNLSADKIDKMLFVTLSQDSVKLGEFLSWYILRSPYIEFDTRNLNVFAGSLESVVWRMVREKLLTNVADERGMFKRSEVIEQVAWWKDKIVFNYVKDEMMNAVLIKDDEVSNSYDQNNSTKETRNSKQRFVNRMKEKITELKNKYSVTINRKLLNDIMPTEKSNPDAKEFYLLKNESFIPRTPYPTIDFIWEVF